MFVQQRKFLMTQRIHSEDSIPANEVSEKQAYEAPVLKVLGADETANGGPGASPDGVTSS